MRRKPPEKDSVEFHRLPSSDPDLATIEVGIKHVGPKMARTWSRRLAAIQESERVRLRRLRKQKIAEHGSEAEAREEEPALFAELIQMELVEKHGDRAKAIEAHPEIFGLAYATEDCEQEYEALFEEMFGAAIAGLRGVEGISETDGAEAARWISYLDGATQLKLALIVIEQQSLTPRQLFRPPDPRDAQPDGPALSDPRG